LDDIKQLSGIKLKLQRYRLLCKLTDIKADDLSCRTLVSIAALLQLCRPLVAQISN